MFNTAFRLIYGDVQGIVPMPDCFSFLITLATSKGTVNVVISSDTFVVDDVPLGPGMHVGIFYDSMAPNTMQSPATYQAIMITSLANQEQVMLNYFDMSLLAADRSLSLNLDASTQMVTANGQRFVCSPGGHVLLVYHSGTTKGIPPKTTPHKIIVFD